MSINSSRVDESQPLRILVLSVRGFRFQAANCCLYEFEDLLCDLESADLYVPTKEFNWANKIYRATKYLSSSDRLAERLRLVGQERRGGERPRIIFGWRIRFVIGSFR